MADTSSIQAMDAASVFPEPDLITPSSESEDSDQEDDDDNDAPAEPPLGVYKKGKSAAKDKKLVKRKVLMLSLSSPSHLGQAKPFSQQSLKSRAKSSPTRARQQEPEKHRPSVREHFPRPPFLNLIDS